MMHILKALALCLEVVELPQGNSLMIVGGACRNLCHGKPINDLDVAILGPDISEHVVATALARAGFGPGPAQRANPKYPVPDLGFEYNIPAKFMGYDVDFLRRCGADNLGTLFSGFDFTVNMVAFRHDQFIGRGAFLMHGDVIEHGTLYAAQHFDSHRQRLDRFAIEFPCYDWNRVDAEAKLAKEKHDEASSQQ